jgi:intracellular septation protein A
VENLRFLPTTILLFVLGMGLGFLNPNRWFILAVGTVVVFPVAAILEMMVAPQSHSVWPIEFVVYGVLGLPSIIGAFVGRVIKC